MTTDWLQPLPLVAILRGLEPDDAVAIGHALSSAGFRLLEVPLNSPEPIESIRRLVDALDETHMVGAGTVLEAGQVAKIADAGGRLIVMPHADTVIIRAAKDADLVCTPGVATATEALAALAAGADGLKLFPADQVSPAGLKAWRAILPDDPPLLPVGGIKLDNMAPWIAAGARGFGIGSALYTPGIAADELAWRAHSFAQAWAEALPPSSDAERSA